MSRHYGLDIEQSFNALKERVTKNVKGGTSCDDVLRFMYENQHQIWFMSWEFVAKQTKAGKFLSHKAPARASDLAIFDSQLVEDRKISRFKAYRLRLENLQLIEKRLNIENQNAMKPRVIDEKCEHGLPTYVKCPNCNN